MVWASLHSPRGITERLSGFEFQVSGFRLQVSDLRFRLQGPGSRVWNICVSGSDLHH